MMLGPFIFCSSRWRAPRCPPHGSWLPDLDARWHRLLGGQQHGPTVGPTGRQESRLAEHPSDLDGGDVDDDGHLLADQVARWKICREDRKRTRLNSSHQIISYA